MTTRIVYTILLSALISACGATRTAAWEVEASAGSTDQAMVDQLKGTIAANWDKRIDRAATEAALADMEKLDAAGGASVEDYVLASRAYYFYSDTHLRFAGEDDAMLESYQKGISMAEKGMLASSDAFKERVKAGERPEDAVGSVELNGQPAMYWYASNLGRWAKQSGFATLLREKDRIKKIMTRVMELDENYFYGGPHRYFGAMYGLAPGFAGGDMDKSKEHFEKAIALAPDYLGTRVLFLEVYAQKEEDEEIWQEQMKVIDATAESALEGMTPENHFEKKKAEGLKAMEEDIFF